MNCNIQLHSNDIINNHDIDIKYTLYGANVLPKFYVSNIPSNAVELVFICYDTDAIKVVGTTWIHYLVYNISPINGEINGTLGTNSFGTVKYDGPKPPLGSKKHLYNYRLFVLNAKSDLLKYKKYKMDDLMKILKDKIICTTSIVGYFGI